MSDPARINEYDARNHTRRGMNTRVVVREKPLLKSRFQRLNDYLRPSMRTGFNVVTGWELSKVMACIIFPAFILMYWKYVEKGVPELFERQFGGMQNRQFKEDHLHDDEPETDYFSIIENFQERRERALQKKQDMHRNA